MLKTLHLTAALSFVLLALVSGCSTTKQPLATSPSQSGGSATKVELPGGTNTSVNPVIPSTKDGALIPPINPDPAANAKVLQYVKLLAAKRFPMQTQGVWIQSGSTLLANHRGTVPLPAASISKVATTLVALQTLGPDYQFVTQIGATGPIQNGVLQGDLVVEGGEDPFFVWEEAVTIGNLLNQMGIKRVTGNLIVVGKFYMNFQDNPQAAGNLLKVGLNSQLWSAAAKTQYQNLPPGTPKPKIVVATVQVSPVPPSNVQPLVRHYSYPLAELLKKMNQYSNNFMADKLADFVGGASTVAQKAAEAAGVPPAEIQLVNGSGLAVENRISPRAACAMFRAIESYLQPLNMTVADVFAIVGVDEGILNKRKIPQLSVVKSGSLNNVSALAGALPTQQQGTVWFAIMNVGGNLEAFRAQQETLLQGFAKQWGTVQSLPTELTPNPARIGKTSRNEEVGR